MKLNFCVINYHLPLFDRGCLFGEFADERRIIVYPEFLLYCCAYLSEALLLQ